MNNVSAASSVLLSDKLSTNSPDKCANTVTLARLSVFPATEVTLNDSFVAPLPTSIVNGVPSVVNPLALLSVKEFTPAKTLADNVPVTSVGRRAVISAVKWPAVATSNL